MTVAAPSLVATLATEHQLHFQREKKLSGCANVQHSVFWRGVKITFIPLNNCYCIYVRYVKDLLMIQTMHRAL